jgi:hypothetical protein
MATEKAISKKPASTEAESLKTKTGSEYAKVFNLLILNIQKKSEEIEKEKDKTKVKSKIKELFSMIKEIYRFDNSYESVGFLVPARDSNKKIFNEVFESQSREFKSYINEGFDLIDNDGPNG